MKIAFIVSVLAVCYAFFASADMLPQFVHELNSRGYDKYAHGLIFFVLELVCVLVFRNWSPISIAMFLVCIGIGIEILQSFTGRSMCILDVFSNCAGLFFALIFIQLLNNFKLKT
jgi:VanZ family protein